MNLGFWDWLAAVIAAVAWPLTVVYLGHQLRDEIAAFLRRVVSLKAGGMEMAAVQERAINTQTESRKSREKGVITEGGNSNGGFRQYENRQIIQKTKVLIPANREVVDTVFPIAFPFEATSVIPVGDADLRVIKLTNTGCHLRVDPVPTEREILLIISGL